MSRSGRWCVVAFLGAVGALAHATPAQAQFAGGFYGVSGNPANPFAVRYSSGLSVSVGGISYSQQFSGLPGLWMQQNLFRPSYPSNDPFSVRVYNGYMSGGVQNPAAAAAAQRDIARAQRAASYETSPTAARTAIYDQWAYEKLGVGGLTGLKPGQDVPAGLAAALAGANERDVVSGEALNHILVAVVAAEGKGGKGQAAFLPPDLLAEVRFSGSPTSDTLNLLRRAGKLEVPSGFDVPAMADSRAVLEQAFAAAVAPVLAGKSADAAKVAALESAVKKARAALEPAIKDMDFEDATAARRFLNQIDSAAAVLKKPTSTALVDPRWSTEGTNVADLVKFMSKQKLLFGPAQKGTEDAYLALHRGLAAYLYVLSESQKPAPKK